MFCILQSNEHNCVCGSRGKSSCTAKGDDSNFNSITAEPFYPQLMRSHSVVYVVDAGMTAISTVCKLCCMYTTVFMCSVELNGFIDCSWLIGSVPVLFFFSLFYVCLSAEGSSVQILARAFPRGVDMLCL